MMPFTARLGYGWQVAATSVFLLAPGLAFCSPVTLFDNFGAGNSYQAADAYCIGGNNPGCGSLSWQPAFAFTPGTTGYVTQIDLALYDASIGAEGSGVISLMADNGGLPGTVSEQWTLVPGADTVYALTSLVNPLLTAGTQYWLAAANTLGAGGVIGWNRTPTADTGPYADMETGSWVLENSVAQQGAFDVLADTVNPQAPEPAGLLTLAAGLLAIAAQLRRRKPNSLRA